MKSMCELRGTSPHSSSINQPRKLKMANQTEETSKRQVVHTKCSSNNSRTLSFSTVGANPGPSSNPTITVHSEATYDHNNNVQTLGQPLQPRLHQSLSVPNEHQRKRSREEESTPGTMKRLKWTLALTLFLSIFPSIQGDAPGNQIQNWDRPVGMPKIAQLEVMCGAQHMEVHLTFDAPFHGLVASKGMYGQSGCVYVPPRTGRTSFAFNIYYDKCGTKPDNHGKFYENTVVVQYDEELIEAWDEAKRLRCEWFNDYEKTATKTSPMVISDLDIVELNFHGDNVDCWMEIQEGKGPWAPPLNGIVPLGSPLTMVVAVKDPTGEFDMRVKACEASDGQGGHVLPLSDSDGCIVRPKLLGKFSKMRIDDGKATVLTYAYISAFKFPDMLNVHLRCTVEICRHGCPNHCSSQYHLPPPGPPKHTSHNFLEPMAFESQNTQNFARPNNLQEEKPQQQPPEPQKPQALHEQKPPPQSQSQSQEIFRLPPPPLKLSEPGYFEEPSVSMIPPPPPLTQQRPPQGRPGQGRPNGPHMQRPGLPQSQQIRKGHGHPYPPSPTPGIFGRGQQKFSTRKFLKNPHGQNSPHRQGLPQGEEDDSSKSASEQYEENNQPRAISEENNQTVESMPVNESLRPLSESTAEELKGGEPAQAETTNEEPFPKGPRQLNLRRRRAVVSNSDVIGIQGSFRVISQADLNFALNLTSTPTPLSSTVLSGRIRDDTVYGICLPRLGFGIVFFGLGLATLVSVLIAAFFTYAHYRATVTSKGTSSVMAMSECQSPGLTTHPVFPMVILRNFW